MKSKGFTLIELLVVIAIMGVLSTIVLASLNNSRSRARDSQRLSDMYQMQLALDMYYNEHGQYPNSDGLGSGGWDVPGDGTFISALVSGGYLPANLRDPTTNNFSGNYRYYRYVASSYGCSPAKQYYVLGVANMETSIGKHPTSPGWSCTSRNWASEMEWVTGKFE